MNIVKVCAYPKLLQVPLPNHILVTYSCTWAVKHNNKTIIKQKDLYNLAYNEWELKQNLVELNIKEPKDIYIEKRRVVVSYADNYKVQLTHCSAGRNIEQAYIKTDTRYIILNKLEDLKQWI
jgi:hypothetical protein